MSKVVYLMGAGASHDTRIGGAITSGLPVVNEISGYMSNRANKVLLYNWGDHTTFKHPNNDTFEVNPDETQKKLSTGLRWLAKQCGKLATIDTFPSCLR